MVYINEKVKNKTKTLYAYDKEEIVFRVKEILTLKGILT